MGVSTTHRINLSMWILIYSFSDTYYVWAACGNAERRRYEIRQEQIHGVREALGFRWVDIARMVGMSPRTFCRRRQEFGMPLGQQ